MLHSTSETKYANICTKFLGAKILRDHGTETRNNFDCVKQSLIWIEKDYHRARGCALSPHFFFLAKLIIIKANLPGVIGEANHPLW